MREERQLEDSYPLSLVQYIYTFYIIFNDPIPGLQEFRTVQYTAWQRLLR
jgi:hypothetical protein